MRVNIFEGSRRILYLGLAVIAGFGLWLTYGNNVSVYRNYSVTTTQDNAFVYTWTKDCSGTDVTESYGTNRYDHWMGGKLCFPTKMVEHGVKVAVLRTAPDGRFFGMQVGTDEFDELTRRASNDFEVPASDQASLAEAVAAQRHHDLMVGAGFTSLAVASIWLLATIVGWIVRGFLGIPFRKDSRDVAS